MKKKSDKHVVGLKDVDEVITVMGQPEDYIIEDENTNNQQTYNYDTSGRKSKKLYLDIDKKYDWWCCSWFESLLGIDVVWIRAIFVFLVLAGFGTGILIYIILWIIAPEAKTTSEKTRDDRRTC
jgi:hypothetical protein